MRNNVIGAYGLCNTASILVHGVDYVEDKILASINGTDMQWCDMCDWEEDGEQKTGFQYYKIKVPLDEVMRV